MKKVNNFLFKYRFIIILVVVFITRAILLNGSIDFFDAFQYLWRSNTGSLKDALTTGHAPYHPGYIFFTYTVNQILKFFNINNVALAASLPSAIFGSLTVVVFFAWVEKMFKTKIALFSALILTIVPFFWISNQAILVDPTMIFFYITSLYLFYRWLDEKNYFWLILSGFSFGYSMWAHTQIAFWALGFVGLMVYKVERKKWLMEAIRSSLWVIGPIFFIYLYLWLLVTSRHNPNYKDALIYLLTGNAGDHMPFSFLPGIRNFSIISTTFLALLSLVGIIKMIFKKTKESFFLIIWLFSGLFISALYLYANLYGRSSMISIFPAIIAASYLLINWQPKNKIVMTTKYLIMILVVVQLLFISLPIVKLYGTQPAPYQELGKIRGNLEPGGVAIISNLAKTAPGYDAKDIVWETPKEQIDVDIKKALEGKKPIFVDSDAIRFPYYKYDGQNWEIQSTVLGGPGEHSSIMAYLYSDFNFDLIKTSKYQYKTGIYQAYKEDKSVNDRLKSNIDALENGQSLIMGKVIDKNLNQPVSRLLIDVYSKNIPLSPQRINYHDSLYYLYNLWQRKIGKEFLDPINWSYTDKNGYFVTFAPENELENKLDFFATSYNLSTNDVIKNTGNEVKFVKAKSTDLSKDSSQLEEGVISINDLAKLSSKLEKQQTFYISIKKLPDNKIFYRYFKTEYTLEFTNSLSADLLAHLIGHDDGHGWVVNKNESGFFIFGPWLSLPKGKYEVDFHVKIGDNSTQGDLGYFQITAEGKKDPLVNKKFATGDFPEINKYKDIVLDFESQGDAGVEFRGWSYGVSNFQIESITLKSK